MNSFIKYNEQLRNLYSSYINEANTDHFEKFFKENDPHEYLRLNESINSLRDLGISLQEKNCQQNVLRL